MSSGRRWQNAGGEIEGVVIARMLYVLFLRSTNIGSGTMIYRHTLSYTSRTQALELEGRDEKDCR